MVRAAQNYMWGGALGCVKFHDIGSVEGAESYVRNTKIRAAPTVKGLGAFGGGREVRLWYILWGVNKNAI